MSQPSSPEDLKARFEPLTVLGTGEFERVRQEMDELYTEVRRKLEERGLPGAVEWKEALDILLEKYKGWEVHPDERVTLALLEHPLTEERERLEAGSWEFELVEHAQRVARERGEAWTPVLDSISRNNRWIDPYFVRGSDEEKSTPDKTKALDEYDADVIRPWVKEHDLQEILRAIQSSKSRWFIKALVEHMPIPPAETLRGIIEKHPYTVYHAAANEGGAEEHAKAIYDFMVEELTRPALLEEEHLRTTWARGEIKDQVGLNKEEKRAARDQQLDQLKRLRTKAILHAQDYLLEKKYIMEPEQEDKLTRRLREETKDGDSISKSEELIVKVLRRQIVRSESKKTIKAFFEFLIEKGASREAGGYIELEGGGLRPPENIPIDLELGRWLVRTGKKHQGVLSGIASRGDLRAEPFIRGVLKENAGRDVATYLLMDQKTEEVRELFKIITEETARELEEEEDKEKMAKRRSQGISSLAVISQIQNAGRAEGILLEIMRRHKNVLAKTLEAEDLTLLFGFKNREGRLAALELLGRIKAREKTHGKIRRT